MRVRKGARIIVRAGDGRILLFHFSYDEGPLSGVDYWGVPGGGVEEGESAVKAAIRELREETGIRTADLGGPVAESGYDFRLCSGEDVREEDTYFLLRLEEKFLPSRDGFTPEESRFMIQHRWWSLEELRNTGENLVPADLAELLARAGID